MKTYKFDVDKVQDLSFRKGMSMARLCKNAGMQRSRATEWKSREVTPLTVYRVAQVLDVEPEELILKEAD